jgi:hypothetical protein
MKRAFTSRVYMEGNVSSAEGSRSLEIKAETDKVTIS